MFPTSEMGDELRSCASLEKLFSFYRVVDYTTHEVYNIVDGELLKAEGHCYDVWRKGGPCHNCISKHTCANDREYIKLEFLDDVVYLVMSVPVRHNSRKYSLELLSDVTRSMFVSSGWKNDNTDVLRIIEDFNDAAVRDSLTGLYNKNYIIDQMLNYFSREDKSEKLAAVILNVDDFKKFNLKYGSDLGDVVIERLANIIKRHVDADDHKVWAGRLGGSSFAVFFLGKPAEYVDEVSRRIREQTAELSFRESDDAPAAYVSVGSTEVADSDTLESFVDRLEKSLYAEMIRRKLEQRRKQQ